MMIKNNFLAKKLRFGISSKVQVSADGGVEVSLQLFLTSTLDGGQCLMSRRPDSFTSEDKTSGRVRGWVGPTADLELFFEKIKFLEN
jgi:hypothetical protein